MKILVCIKQVPDMESKFRVNDEANWYDNDDLAWRMNEYDEYAVEQAVQLKEETGDSDLTVLCIGPDRVKETMKKALAMGCDRGAHIQDDDFFKKDPVGIAAIIADYSRKKGFDIIFTGMQSQDRGSGQVGVLVGEMLDMECITTVIDFSYSAGEINVKRELEGGIRAKVKTSTPAVITCQLGLNTPRYPTLPNIMKAKKKELLSTPASELLKIKNQQQTASIYSPEKKGGGLILEGDAADIADQLIKILKDKTNVLA